MPTSSLQSTKAMSKCLAALLSKNGANLSEMDNEGFTPLHRIVTNDQIKIKSLCEMIEMMTMAFDADPNIISGDGRSVLSMAALRPKSSKIVQALLFYGANPDTVDGEGVHIVDRKLSPAVKKLLLNSLSNRPKSSSKAKKKKKVTKAKWSGLRKKITEVFAVLEKSNVLCMHEAGFTMSDGFEDCQNEVKAGKRIKKSDLLGYCFYTTQDLESAKDLHCLNMAFWGAPKGGRKPTLIVGNLIVDSFRNAGFDVDWDGTVETRPSIWLI